MKRFIFTALGLVYTLLFAQPLFADAKKESSLELSGLVSVITGYQHDDKNAVPSARGGLGRFRGDAGPSHNSFGFYLDEVELDVEKHFSDKIRLRADLQFGNMATGFDSFELEQGYIGFTLPFGKGIETILGHFNAPIGFENTATISDNIALSLAPISGPTMTNVTGAIVTYPFADLFTASFYLFNNMRDEIEGSSCIPSSAAHLELHWGTEGSKSHIAYSFAAGPDRPNENRHWRFVHDVEFFFQITSQFSIGGEGLYIRDNAVPPETNNDIVYGGMLVFRYGLSEHLYTFLRYNFLRDRGPSHEALGDASDVHSQSVGIGYKITEGALMKLEYRPDVFIPISTPVSLSHSIASEFVYNF